jgi:MFS family permease
VPVTDETRRARLGTSAAFAMQGLVFACVLTRVPAIKERFGFSDGELTVLLAVIPLIAGTGSALADVLARRFGGAPVLRGAALVACVAATGIGLAPVRPALFVALFGYGLVVGAVDATMNMQGVAVQARYGRSIMNGFHAVWSLAGIAGALYTSAVADRLGPGASIGIAACFGALAILLGGPWLSTVTSGRRAAPDSAVITGVVPPEEGAERPNGRDQRQDVVPWRVLLPVGVVLACVYVADSGVSNWGAVYLRDTLLSSEGVAALGYAAYQGTALLGRMAGDRLVGRFGTALVVRCAVAVAALGLLAVLIAPGPAPAVAGFAVLGLGASVLVPLTFSAAGRLDGGRGTAVARVNLFNYAGYLLGAPLVGAVGALAGLRYGWVAPLLLLGVVVALAPRLGPGSAVGADERAQLGQHGA